MATHSSVLAWRIPGMVEPGGLPSMGPHRVEHDWSDAEAAADFPGGSDGKESVYNAWDPGSSPGLGRSLEKEIAIHSSTTAWKIPWTEEPGRLQSMGSQRVGHDWATSVSLFTFMHWRRKWQPTSVFLPGESQGWWSLVGCRLWGCTESDTTEAI